MTPSAMVSPSTLACARSCSSRVINGLAFTIRRVRIRGFRHYGGIEEAHIQGPGAFSLPLCLCIASPDMVTSQRSSKQPHPAKNESPTRARRRCKQRIRRRSARLRRAVPRYVQFIMCIRASIEARSLQGHLQGLSKTEKKKLRITQLRSQVQAARETAPPSAGAQVSSKKVYVLFLPFLP